MRRVVVLGLLAVWALPARAEVPPRFKVAADAAYPQGTPKEALASVVKAAEAGRADYLLAHLSEPAFTDARVKQLGGFPQAVRILATRLEDDANLTKTLRRYLMDGEWKEEGETATVRLKDMPDRAVTFKKRGDRWFLVNETRPPGE